MDTILILKHVFETFPPMAPLVNLRRIAVVNRDNLGGGVGLYFARYGPFVGRLRMSLDVEYGGPRRLVYQRQLA